MNSLPNICFESNATLLGFVPQARFVQILLVRVGGVRGVPGNSPGDRAG